MTKNLLIINPHASGGRALKTWRQNEAVFHSTFPNTIVAITESIDALNQHIRSAYQNQVEQIIGLGGDGTNHSIINAIMHVGEHFPTARHPIFGTLPVGTGCDWARSLGIPQNMTEAIHWLKTASPQPTDIGLLDFGDRQRYFLNIASAGLGGEVDARVNRVQNRRPWTFFRATVEAMLYYRPRHIRIKIDGNDWMNDRALLTVIANGTTFGHGMKIAPQALNNDGLFEVIYVEAMSTLGALTAFRRVYNGSHLSHPRVHHVQAQTVEVISEGEPIQLDLDGEYAQANHIRFEVIPQKLQLLVGRNT